MYTTSIGQFDGNRWEELCQTCFKLKYEADGYQPIPAINGDFGIEGFTRSGLVFQCYCPDNNVDNKTLYEHQRDKITRDLNKLVTYNTQLELYLKEVKIKRWIFVTPEVSRKDIIKHCQDKAAEFKSKNLAILSDCFDVLVYDIDNFAVEIPKVLNYNNEELDYSAVDVTDEIKVDWVGSSITLINNANTKNRKLLGNVSDLDTKIDKLTNRNVEETLKGDIIVSRWRDHFPEQYVKFLNVVDAIESDVELECMVPCSNNMERYNSFKTLVYEKLKQNFPNLSDVMLINLRNKVISDWILNCPINFD